MDEEKSDFNIKQAEGEKGAKKVKEDADKEHNAFKSPLVTGKKLKYLFSDVGR